MESIHVRSTNVLILETFARTSRLSFRGGDAEPGTHERPRRRS